MSMHASKNNENPDLTRPSTVLELMVNNHPGVMSQVCGLFSRRAFNVDGILCIPSSDERRSRIWLKVNEDDRLDQMMCQLRKLVDVQEVRRHAACHTVFLRLEEFFCNHSNSTIARMW